MRGEAQVINVCPHAEKIGAQGASIEAVLRELSQLRNGFKDDLRDQDARLMAQIEDKFGIKLAACEGLEERVDAHDDRIGAVEKSQATHRGWMMAQRGWVHVILGLFYAGIGAAGAMFGAHLPLKH